MQAGHEVLVEVAWSDNHGGRAVGVLAHDLVEQVVQRHSGALTDDPSGDSVGDRDHSGDRVPKGLHHLPALRLAIGREQLRETTERHFGLMHQVGEIGPTGLVGGAALTAKGVHLLRARREELLEAATFGHLTLLKGFPLEGAAQLRTKRRGELQKAFVGASRSRVHELDDGGDLHTGDDREGPGRTTRNRHVAWVVAGRRQIRQPQGEMGSGHLTREAPGRYEPLLDGRSHDDVEELHRGGIRIPDVGRHERATRIGDEHVGHREVAVPTEHLGRGTERRQGIPAVVDEHGDLGEELDLARAFVRAAQLALGDELGLQPGRPLARGTSFQTRDCLGRRLAGTQVVAHDVVLTRSTHSSSPRRVHCG